MISLNFPPSPSSMKEIRRRWRKKGSQMVNLSEKSKKADDILRIHKCVQYTRFIDKCFDFTLINSMTVKRFNAIFHSTIPIQGRGGRGWGLISTT